MTDIASSAAAEETERCEQEGSSHEEKILITGDDVLIEYVVRMVNMLKGLSDAIVEPLWRSCVEKFVMHYVWHSKDLRKADPSARLWQRLEARLFEMKERRRRLVKNLYKKEGRLNEFEKSYEKSMRQKGQVIRTFDAA